jgi:calcium/calmodulin-dependent protein kinase I
VNVTHFKKKMPLFGKKDPAKKSKKDSDKQPSVEDKYNLKELLGT